MRLGSHLIVDYVNGNWLTYFTHNFTLRVRYREARGDA